MNKNIGNNREDEVNLMELLSRLWLSRKTILKFTFVFGLIGLFIAFFSENTYTAKTSVIAHTSTSNKLSGLSGFAAIAGINLVADKGNSTISPSLYPKVISSIPYKRDLLNTQITIGDEKVSYRDYFLKYYKPSMLSNIKKYTVGLPGVIFGLVTGETKTVDTEVVNDSIYRISVKEQKLFGLIDDQLSVEINGKGGFIDISFTMPEALASAEMLKHATNLLQKRVREYKTNKALSEYKFIKNNYEVSKKDLLDKQENLANFEDTHRGLVYSRSKSRLNILRSEYTLANNVYSEFAKQLETQKIKLKENTPLFTTIEPVSVPMQKSNPKTLLIIIVWLFLGSVCGIGVVIGKKIFKGLIKIESFS